MSEKPPITNPRVDPALLRAMAAKRGAAFQQPIQHGPVRGPEVRDVPPGVTEK